MRALVFLTLALTFAPTAFPDNPVYSAASIVNAADNQVGPLAPNTIATIYGQNLAYGTAALTAGDVLGGVLPTALAGTQVRVLIGGEGANLYYASPTQINFLVPSDLLPLTANLQLVIDGLDGPAIPIQLAASAPALFQLDAQNAVATKADGSVLRPTAPAAPGDIVILYATGLGQTNPPVESGVLPTEAAPLSDIADFSVVLDGTAVEPKAIAYAGIAPGFAGLYQINVTRPASTGPNPQIQIGLGGVLSPPGVHLPVQ
ncbi:MAG: hypothetical protein ABSB86_19935 [Bryobacteraceae bacterium]